MDAAKMSRAQIAKFIAEAKKQKFDGKGWQQVRKSRQDVTQAGKALQQIAKQNPQV